MFNINDYLASDYHYDTVEEKIGNETFLIRRLNGYERLEFLDCKTLPERIVFTLSHALLDGNSKQPIGKNNAKKFIERYDSLSDEIASRIINLTTEYAKVEKSEWGIAEKNLQGTVTNGYTDNTAAVTD